MRSSYEKCMVTECSRPLTTLCTFSAPASSLIATRNCSDGRSGDRPAARLTASHLRDATNY